MRLLLHFLVTIVVAKVAFGADALKIYISADMEGVGGVSTWDVQAETKGANMRSSGD